MGILSPPLSLPLSTWPDLTPSHSPFSILHPISFSFFGSFAPVVWTNAVDSLGAALRHYRYDPTPDEYEALASRGQLTARQFVHRHMLQIVNILLDQYASKTGHNERACVEGSLRHSVAICATDLGERAQFLRGVGGGGGGGPPPP